MRCNWNLSIDTETRKSVAVEVVPCLISTSISIFSKRIKYINISHNLNFNLEKEVWISIISGNTHQQEYNLT